MPTSTARPRKYRTWLFFGLVIATIALINTPAPKVILSAVFDTAVGESVGNSLRGLTRDLFLLLLVSIYFEFIRAHIQAKTLQAIEDDIRDVRTQIGTIFPKRIQSLVLESADPRKMIEHAVRRLFKSDLEMHSVVSQLAPSKRIYKEVSIELESHQVTIKQVELTISINLEAELRNVYLGVTKRAEHTTALTNSELDFFDVITIPGDPELESAQEAIRAQLKFYFQDITKRSKELTFISLSKTEQEALLSPPTGMTHDDFIVFRFPPNAMHAGPQKVRAKYKLTIPYTEHFIYWCADRPMFVRQLTVDASSIASFSGHQVRFQLFIAGSESTALDTHESKLSIKPNKWLLDGHGVAAIW